MSHAAGIPNSFVGSMGERIVIALAEQLVGEPVKAVGVGKGGTEHVDLESAHFAIEVKTVVIGTEEKIKPSAKALREKVEYATLAGKRGMSILVVLNPAGWTARIYRRDELGAYRSSGMRDLGTFQVKDILTPHPGWKRLEDL